MNKAVKAIDAAVAAIDAAEEAVDEELYRGQFDDSWHTCQKARELVEQLYDLLPDHIRHPRRRKKNVVCN